MSLQLLVSKTHPNAKLPVIKTSGSAGYDLFSVDGGGIAPGCRMLISTGIIMKVPENHCGQIWSRSGLSLRNGVETGAGVIDSDYTDELMVLLYNFSKEDFIFEPHTRIAQILIVPIPNTHLVETKPEDIQKMKQYIMSRSGGFGSTGLY